MFPLTHLYIAKAVLGYETRLSSLGALFPDYGTYLGIGRNLCHEMGIDMYHYAREAVLDHVDFALGALTHGVALPGIDWYADEEYHGVRPGYCFQAGEAIAEEVGKACCLPRGMQLWKTHNVVEMAFDAITEQKHPHIAATALSALPKEGKDFCTVFLQGYLGQSKEDIRHMFAEVSTYFSFDGNDLEAMAEKFIVSLDRRHGIRGCDQRSLVELIKKSIDIVAPVYDDFMAETIEKITLTLYKRTGIKRPSV